jgi:hypothetical protein
MSTSDRSRTIRRAAWGVAAAAGISLAVFLTLAARVAYPLERLSFTADPGTWRGVYHVHTQASDGRGTIADVVAAARASGAAWVLVADHNRLDGPRARIVDGILLVFSPEVSALDGHVTALGVSRALTREERRATGALATIRALGGTPVAAHPLGRKRPYLRLDDPLLGGIEILSADQEFRDALVSPLRLLPAALTYAVNPEHAVMRLLRRPARTLARWDQLLAVRRMAGFCAVDAHGRPPYNVMMAALQMHAEVGHAPTGDAAADGAALIDALAGGRSFCGIEAIAGAGGFSFTGADSAGGTANGRELRLDRHPVVHVGLAYASLPPGTRPVLVCNGMEVPMTASPAPRGRRYEYRPDKPGACRVEVLVDNGSGGTWPWILSNPIYIR